MRTAYLLGALGLFTGTVLGYVFAVKTIDTTEASLVKTAQSVSVEKTSVPIQTRTPLDVSYNDVSRNAIAVGNTATLASQNTDPIPSTAVDQISLEFLRVREASFGKLYELMQYLAGSGFPELEQHAAQIMGLNEREAWEHEAAFQLIISRMVELDEDQALAFITLSYGNDRSGRNNHWYSNAIAALSHTHIDELIAWADSQPSKQQRIALMSEILRGYAQIEPRRAIAIYQQQDFGGAQSRGQDYPHDILHAWSQKEPEAAINWVMTQSDFNINNGALHSAFSSWAYKDPDAANAYLSTIADERVRSELEVIVLDGLAQENPQAALEQALASSEHHTRFAGIQSVLMSWGASAPMEAIDYARNYLSGQEQEMAYQILASTVHMHDYGLFGSGPLETLQQSQNLPVPIQQAIRESTIGMLFDEDPAAALAFIDSVADENERTQLLASVAWQLPAYDMQLAQMIYEQSSAEVRSVLGGSIAQHLIETDPEQANYWYEQQPEGQIRNQMRYMMAERLAMTDPLQALTMFDGTDEINDLGMLGSVFFRVARLNSSAAEQWLQQANVSDSLRAELTQIMKDLSSQQFYMHGFEGAAAEY